MANHTGKFLTAYQMAEAKRSEAVMNAVQKREGTNHPPTDIVAWSCGCCIGPSLKRDKTIATADEAAAILKSRKAKNKHGTVHPTYITMEQLRETLATMPTSWERFLASHP